MSDIAPENQATVSAFKEMLSFYGIELQSHASVILGLGLIIFAIAQAWATLPMTSRSNGYSGLSFAIITGAIGAGIVYEFWRLYVFGKLASALLYSSDAAFNEIVDQFNNERKDNPNAQWQHLTEFGRVSEYAERRLRVSAKRLVDFGALRDMNMRVRLRFWVLALAFEGGFEVSYILLFGSSDLYVASGYGLLLGVVIIVGYPALKYAGRHCHDS